MNSTILVTGGTGYIGSHTVVELLNSGASVVVIDNLSNSTRFVIDQIQTITGKCPVFIRGDVRSSTDLRKIFKNYEIDSVIHFAGVKAVGESAIDPIKYYDNNVGGTLTLIKEMSKACVQEIVFSSSATVYGTVNAVPIKEELAVLNPISPYGQSKLIIENIFHDLKKSNMAWKIALLRYFNPVGAHSSGLIGENPRGTPNNLMPLIAQVAIGKQKQLSVYGNDYPTQDGTARRDYIHVDDLAKGHIAALSSLKNNEKIIVVNLGTGKAYSVLEVISTYEQVSGQKIHYDIAARRSGDVAECYADTTKACEILSWKANHSLYQMCKDSWKFAQSLNDIVHK